MQYAQNNAVKFNTNKQNKAVSLRVHIYVNFAQKNAQTIAFSLFI